MWKTFWFTLNIILVFCVTAASAQQIYKWKDENGQWHFSQTPLSEAIASSFREATYQPIDRERPSDLQHTGAGSTNQLAIIYPALKLKGDELHVTGITNTSEEIRLAEEKPRVIVLRSGLEKGRGVEVYFVGKVYNSGYGVAKNVNVFFTIINLRGVKVAQGTVRIKELSPGGESSFRKRVMSLWDVKGLSVTAQLK